MNLLKTDKKNKNIILKLIFILSLIVFVFSAAILVNKLIAIPYKNSKLNKEIKNIYYSNPDEEIKENKNLWYENLQRIREINPDIIGWINIKNTIIDYPVLQPPEGKPAYYLRKTYKKEYLLHGSIFVDAKSNIYKNPKNTIIHGHRMNDGSMFKKLLDYTNDLDFYKSAPTINFDTEKDGKEVYKIFSAFRTNTLPEHGKIFEYIKSDFKDDSEFLNFIHQSRIRSFIHMPVDIDENDKIITLSTCSYEMKHFRTVVMARKVRPGESLEVDVDAALKNKCPVLPEAYYPIYNTPVPTIYTFEDSLKDQKIFWYKKNEPKKPAKK